MIASHGNTEFKKGWRGKEPITAILQWRANYTSHRKSLCEFVRTNPRLAPTRWAQRIA
jgi:hypothetical protein